MPDVLFQTVQKLSLQRGFHWRGPAHHKITIPAKIHQVCFWAPAGPLIFSLSAVTFWPPLLLRPLTAKGYANTQDLLSFTKTAFPGEVSWKHPAITAKQKQSPGMMENRRDYSFHLPKGHCDMPLTTVDSNRPHRMAV